MLTDVGTLGVAYVVHGHREAVASTVGALGAERLERFDAGRHAVGAGGEAVEGAAEAVLVIDVGSFEAGEAGDVGIDAEPFEDERVAGGEGLDLA